VEVDALVLTKENGDGLPGVSGVHTWGTAGGSPQAALEKTPWKTSVMFSIGNAAAEGALNVINCCAGAGGEKGALGLKTGSAARFKSRMLTVVPPRLAAKNDPVRPVPPIEAWSAVKAGLVFVHVIVVAVTVMLPAIVNCPKIGDADKVALHVAANNATSKSVLNLLPRISVVFILPRWSKVCATFKIAMLNPDPSLSKRLNSCDCA
jgi:hypothetical protein